MFGRAKADANSSSGEDAEPNDSSSDEAGAPSAASPARGAARGSPSKRKGWGKSTKTPKGGKAAKVPRPAAASSAESADAADDEDAPVPEVLALGLTEPFKSTVLPPAKQAAFEAELYRTPRTDALAMFSMCVGKSDIVLNREDAGTSAELREQQEAGLHIEQMPHLHSRSARLLDARLGDGFDAPSKAGRLEDGTVIRQPDPVRHVRVRPSHPGMGTEVETAHPRATRMLVDAASRTASVAHTLQISIGLVQLHDHPFFSREHQLQRKLRTLAEQLGELHQREALLVCKRRVVELRRRVEPFLGGREPPSEAAELERLGGLLRELTQARRERDQCEIAERLLGRKMYKLWLQLKLERKRQGGFSSTRAKLQVQRVIEEEDLEKDLDDELDEKRLLHALPGGPVEPFDEEVERRRASEQQRSHRRAPGEETLVPVYTEDTPPTDFGRLPREEQRRQIDRQMHLYAVLLVDERVVGMTRVVELNIFDFCARFSFSVQMQLLQAPSSISMQLWQRRLSGSILAGLADRMLAEVFLAVPEVASPAAPRWQHYDFASDKTFKPAPGRANDDDEEDAGFGSVQAVPLRCLCGQAAVSIAWAAQPAARAERREARPASFIGARSRGSVEVQTGALDAGKVREHVQAEDLDPNAPQDVPLLSLLSRGDHAGVGGAFRAYRFGRELQLMKNWLRSDRLKLLQLRRERPHDWQALPTRAVPTRDTEIPTKMREMLTRGRGARAGEDDEEIEDSRQQSKIRAWAQSVLSRQQRAQTSAAYVLETVDVVREPLLEVEIEAFDCEAFLEKLFLTRRKLRPKPKPRKAQPGSAEVTRHLEIVVVEGVDLPMRSSRDGGVESTAPSHLCVEVSFQGQLERTETKAGPDPIWNQRMQLAMTAPDGDWSQRSLMSMHDSVSFNLFDKVQRTRRDDRDATLRTLREEQRWLGSFTVPFSTLYRNGEVKGVFPLAMPPILLGYAKDKQSSSKNPSGMPSSALKLFVTVEPLLPPLKAEVRQRFTAQDATMQEYAQRWIKTTLKSLPPQFRDRQLQVFAPTASGDKALVCRFVRAQNPPDGEMMLTKSQPDDKRLLRFVSLVPFLDDAALGAHLDVWNTNDSFLELLAGDSEEHALLLCSYFLHNHAKDAYVLLGNELPDGETAYVLTLGDGGVGSVRIWNAHTGKMYAKEDRVSPLSACPLTSIGCVFNARNVWANKQLTDKPWEMSWDLSDAKCWRPFFEKATTNPMPTPQEWTVKPGLQPLQKKTLQYRKMTEDYRNDLEREVEDRLQREFEDLRGHRPTDWNRSLANTLKKLLRRFEDDAAGTLPLTKEEHEAELSRIRTTYSPVGFPIHAKLTEGASLKPLIEKLRNTNLWISDSPKIQFALSAYVHPYPNNLASVWVYVAALHDQRSANIGP